MPLDHRFLEGKIFVNIPRVEISQNNLKTKQLSPNILIMELLNFAQRADGSWTSLMIPVHLCGQQFIKIPHNAVKCDNNNDYCIPLSFKNF